MTVVFPRFLAPICLALAACSGDTKNKGKPYASVFYQDADGDGYGTAGVVEEAREPPAGFVANDGDCDDGDASVHRGAVEVCDGEDDDCDGVADDEAIVHPGAGEPCNVTDDDCDGLIDEDYDTDGDGFPGDACGGADCDDSDPAVHRGPTRSAMTAWTTTATGRTCRVASPALCASRMPMVPGPLPGRTPTSRASSMWPTSTATGSTTCSPPPASTITGRAVDTWSPAADRQPRRRHRGLASRR